MVGTEEERNISAFHDWYVGEISEVISPKLTAEIYKSKQSVYKHFFEFTK